MLRPLSLLSQIYAYLGMRVFVQNIGVGELYAKTDQAMGKQRQPAQRWCAVLRRTDSYPSGDFWQFCEVVTVVS